MVKYDAAVIYEFAARLYSKADWIGAIYAAAGLVLGAMVSWAGMTIFLARGIEISPVVPLIFAAVGAGIGFAAGNEKGFLLRLQGAAGALSREDRGEHAAGGGGRKVCGLTISQE